MGQRDAHDSPKHFMFQNTENVVFIGTISCNVFKDNRKLERYIGKMLESMNPFLGRNILTMLLTYINEKLYLWMVKSVQIKNFADII